jgi:hypothetical protein
VPYPSPVFSPWLLSAQRGNFGLVETADLFAATLKVPALVPAACEPPEARNGLQSKTTAAQESRTGRGRETGVHTIEMLGQDPSSGILQALLRFLELPLSFFFFFFSSNDAFCLRLSALVAPTRPA